MSKKIRQKHKQKSFKILQLKVVKRHVEKLKKPTNYSKMPAVLSEETQVQYLAELKYNNKKVYSLFHVNLFRTN